MNYFFSIFVENSWTSSRHLGTPWGQISDVLEQSKRHLRILRDIWGHLWDIFETFRGNLGDILGAYWGYMRASCEYLENLLKHLGEI